VCCSTTINLLLLLLLLLQAFKHWYKNQHKLSTDVEKGVVSYNSEEYDPSGDGSSNDAEERSSSSSDEEDYFSRRSKIKANHNNELGK
jgi:hypothetical protein